MKLKENEYQCAMCGRVFQKAWSDEEIKKEYTDLFGTMITQDQDDDLGIICDDCCQKLS
jgi:DNA-directed RNA polymerase subunit RPC12/RpoP